MKTVAYAAAGLLTSLLLVPAACAQSQADQSQGPNPGSYDTGYQDGMRAAREKYAADIIERMRGRSENGEDEDEDSSDSGAHFRLIRGNARLDVKCGSEDSTEKCVESAIMLMDRAGVERREAKAAPQPPAAGSSAPAPAPKRQ